MATKKTYINADQELVIQGKLTIEGEVVQQEDTVKVNNLQSDELVIRFLLLLISNKPSIPALEVFNTIFRGSWVFMRGIFFWINFLQILLASKILF